ncbi:hypothetical protein [Nocardiopsis suaedae]|uniref:Uncharacterized protein n=1 Tax=Nocardiopsis suaedae TaxID=3018444 RepID=A0ABT4TIA3_9ACTN|nr:hypothetical protein [Nocardiopsis suaedae]MDA2804401.1 hypothetical protein [Nocardiopsis suaedae]
MRTSRLTILVSLAAGCAAVLLSLATLRPLVTGGATAASAASGPSGADGAQESAAMTADEFARAESPFWPPGEGASGPVSQAADDTGGEGGDEAEAGVGDPSDLPEGWRTVEEVGLVLPVHEDWGRMDPEEAPFPEGTEAGYADPEVGGLQVLSGYPADEFDAHRAVIRFVNELSSTGEVMSAFTPVDAPPGLHGAAYAEFVLNPRGAELKEAAGGSLSGVLLGVQPEEDDDPLVLWWEWPTGDGPEDVMEIVTGVVRPAE